MCALLGCMMDTCTRVNLCSHVLSLVGHLHSLALHPAVVVLCQPSLPAGTKRDLLNAQTCQTSRCVLSEEKVRVLKTFGRIISGRNVNKITKRRIS